MKNIKSWLILVHFVLLLYYIISSYKKELNNIQKIFKKYRTFDEYFTEKIRKITGDNTINVFSVGSDQPNALYIPEDNHIYYLDPIFDILTEDEVTAVLLHEYSHYKDKDEKFIKKGRMFNVIISSIIFGIFVNLNIKWFYYIFALPIGLYLGFKGGKFAESRLRRISEYTADSYATKKGYGKHLINAYIKLETEYVTNFSKSISKMNKIEKIKKQIKSDLMHVFDTHPHMYDRIIKIFKEEGQVKNKGNIKTLSRINKRLLKLVSK